MRLLHYTLSSIFLKIDFLSINSQSILWISFLTPFLGSIIISINIFATDDDDDTIFDSTEIIVCSFYADGFHLVECKDGFDILLNILENKDNNLKNIALCRY